LSLFLVSCSVWPLSLLEAAFFFCYSSTALAGGYSCVTLTLTLTLLHPTKVGWPAYPGDFPVVIIQPWLAAMSTKKVPALLICLHSMSRLFGN